MANNPVPLPIRQNKGNWPHLADKQPRYDDVKENDVLPPPPPVTPTPQVQVRKKIDEVIEPKSNHSRNGSKSSSPTKNSNSLVSTPPLNKIEPKKAYVVDQSKRPDIIPKPFVKLIEDESSESMTSSAFTDDSDDYGFMDLPVHEINIPVKIIERSCWIR